MGHGGGGQHRAPSRLLGVQPTASSVRSSVAWPKLSFHSGARLTPFFVHCLRQQQRVLRPGQEAVAAVYCPARRPLGVGAPHPAAMPHAPRSRTMTERCTLDGFVITPIEPQGSLYAGTDHGRLFINEAQTGVMAWWSMGRWTDRAARGDHRPSHDHDARGLSPLVCPPRGFLPRRLTGGLRRSHYAEAPRSAQDPCTSTTNRVHLYTGTPGSLPYAPPSCRLGRAWRWLPRKMVPRSETHLKKAKRTPPPRGARTLLPSPSLLQPLHDAGWGNYTVLHHLPQTAKMSEVLWEFLAPTHRWRPIGRPWRNSSPWRSPPGMSPSFREGNARSGCAN